jgi:hypothetical protein
MTVAMCQGCCRASSVYKVLALSLVSWLKGVRPIRSQFCISSPCLCRLWAQALRRMFSTEFLRRETAHENPIHHSHWPQYHQYKDKPGVSTGIWVIEDDNWDQVD